MGRTDRQLLRFCEPMSRKVEAESRARPHRYCFHFDESLRQKRKPRYTPVARGVARGDRLAQPIHSRFDDDERRRKARVCTHSWG
jgi:hypothetical protein